MIIRIRSATLGLCISHFSCATLGCTFPVKSSVDQPPTVVAEHHSAFCEGIGRDATWCEDFSTLRDGTLPEGWVGADGLGVKRIDGRAEFGPLEPKAQYQISLPDIRLKGDFRVDVAWRTAPNDSTSAKHYTISMGDLNATLETSWGGGWPGHFALDATVSPGLGDVSHSNVLVTIVREGDVVKAFVNGKSVAMLRRPAQDIEGIGLSLQGAGTEAALLGVSTATSGMARVKASTNQKTSARRYCREADSYCQDFLETGEGLLPSEWTEGDGLGVKTFKSKKVLSVLEPRATYQMGNKAIVLKGDFSVSVLWRTAPDADTEHPKRYAIVLGPMTAALETSWGGGWPSRFVLGQATPGNLPDLSNQEVLVTLKREGEVFKAFVNTKPVATVRGTSTDFPGIALLMEHVGSDAGIAGIRVEGGVAPPTVVAEPAVAEVERPDPLISSNAAAAVNASTNVNASREWFGALAAQDPARLVQAISFPFWVHGITTNTGPQSKTCALEALASDTGAFAHVGQCMMGDDLFIETVGRVASDAGSWSVVEYEEVAKAFSDMNKTRLEDLRATSTFVLLYAPGNGVNFTTVFAVSKDSQKVRAAIAKSDFFE